jgi:predicted nucleic acid-binding Zn finger protein
VDNSVAVPAEKKILPRILSNEDSKVSELSVVSKVDIFVTLGAIISTLHFCGCRCCMCLFNEGRGELCIWTIALLVSSTVLVIGLMSFGWTGS